MLNTIVMLHKRLPKGSNNFGLSVRLNAAIAHKGRQDALMAEILRPCLVLLRSLAELLAKPDESFP